MTEPLQNLCIEIETVLDGIASIRKVKASNTAAGWPVAFAFPASGTFDAGPIGTRKGLHDISIWVLTPKGDITRDNDILRPLVDEVPAAMLAQMTENGARFNGALSTFGGVRYQALSVQYAGVDCRGYEFVLQQCKILTT